jgi:predicted transcriptional regulator
MSDQLLIRDVMRIGVATCKMEDMLQQVAALMVDQAASALVVLDEDGDTRGWINERMLGNEYLRFAQSPEGSPALTAADIMDERVPEAPSDIPLTAAAQLMADIGADHLFFLHRAGGRIWPASVVSHRDLIRAMAGPEYIQGQGTAAPRPTPMDLFRQRYGLPPKK